MFIPAFILLFAVLAFVVLIAVVRGVALVVAFWTLLGWFGLSPWIRVPALAVLILGFAYLWRRDRLKKRGTDPVPTSTEHIG
jgi:hypothetical protein